MSRHMGYTKTNLRQVEDSAAKHGVGEFQEARFPRTEIGAEQTGMNYLIVKPGRREPFAHLHREAEEIYVVLSGAGRVMLDDELVELGAFDIVRVGPGTTRKFEAGDAGLEVLIFGRRVEGDGEIIEDFWAD
jgi:mannose-6-phosphate isomerase-like protein (cupin superfamily)